MLARKAVAISLLLLAAIVLAIGTFSGVMLFDTRSLNVERMVLQDFQRTEKFVQGYQARQKHLPSDADLDAWVKQAPLDYTREDGFLHIRPSPIHFCNEKDTFGSAPGDDFVLLVWRGEIFDCYASPSGKNTLLLSKTDWLKNNLKAFGLISAALLATGAVLLYGGIRLFRWRPKRREGYAASNS
jgi:hypothetical protein